MRPHTHFVLFRNHKEIISQKPMSTNKLAFKFLLVAGLEGKNCEILRKTDETKSVDFIFLITSASQKF